jgi:hypothetical protein
LEETTDATESDFAERDKVLFEETTDATESDFAERDAVSSFAVGVVSRTGTLEEAGSIVVVVSFSFVFSSLNGSSFLTASETTLFWRAVAF